MDWVARAYDGSEVMMATVAGPDFRFVAANRAYLSFHGLTDVVGHRPTDLWPELEGQQLVQFLQRVRADGRPGSFTEWHFQFERNGELDDVYLDFDLTPDLVDGEVVAIHFYLRVVTDRVRARLESEHDLSEARGQYADALESISRLQDQLLPDALPALPRVDVAASYLLAGAHQSAGGDWFDCISRPDGTVALVVGDVVGHGVAASAVMGQLRAVLGSALLASGDVEEALHELDRYARAHGGGAAGATVCVASLDPATGRLQVASAGHPAPVVVPTSGEGWFVPLVGSAPLASPGAGVDGWVGGGRFATDEVQLDHGDTVVLLTDGLVERPGRTPAESTVEVLNVMTDLCQGRGPVRGRARAVDHATLDGLEMLLRETGHHDDVTVLAAQWTTPPPPLHVRVEATDEGSRTARHALVDWLDVLDIGVVDRVTVQHAAGELLDNVVAHAYDGAAAGRGELGLEAALEEGGTLRCRVLDDGTWRERGGHGGADRSPLRGLAMTKALVDEFSVLPGGDSGGTVAELRQRLTRPARLLATANASPARLPRTHPGEVSVEQSQDVLRVSGEVDGAAAGTLRAMLVGTIGGGSLPAVVDLSDVTHLGSAGVQVLHELAGMGTQVTLRAPNGSVAQHVLSLVRLPFEG